MKHAKPTQPIYRPGNGPLRKSNTFEDSESDTNLVLNTKGPVNNDNGEYGNNVKFKSEGNSPREKLPTRNFGGSSGDAIMNESGRRQKKPEQMLYVPRAVQARETSVQQTTSNSYSNMNGNNAPSNTSRDEVYQNTNNCTRSLPDKRVESNSKWIDGPSSSHRYRQGSEPRGNFSFLVIIVICSFYLFFLCFV